MTVAYSGDSGFVGSASTELVQVIDLKSTSTALTTSLNPALGGGAVTFTATVTSAFGGTPTGTVTFLDDGTPIGTQTLDANATAVLNVSSLAVGSHMISAGYDGDTNYSISTSTVLSQAMAAALFAVPAPKVVVAGQSVVIPLTLYAASGSDLSFALICLGLPANSSCTFNPNPVTPAQPPTGTAISLTFSTQAASSLLPAPQIRPTWPFGLVGSFMALAAILCAGYIPWGRPWPRLAFGMCLTAFMLAAVIGGCSGSGSYGGNGNGSIGGSIGTSKGPATFTVIGTSGTTTVSTSVSVDVQ
jgi:hypothetical protein